MIHKDSFNKDIEFAGSKGAVFIEGKMLVCRRDGNTDLCPHKIDIPGGAREEGETPFDTFKREVKEEYGIDIKKEDICSSFIYLEEKGREAFFFVTKQLEYKEEDIKFGNEGEEWMLMDVDEFVTREDGMESQHVAVRENIEEIENCRGN